MKQFLVVVQDRVSKHVYGYIEIETTGNSIYEDKHCAKGIALKQIEKEMQYTKQWDKLQGVDWCLDAVEI